MAKKKTTEENIELSSFDKLFNKYKGTGSLFEAPKNLEDIDVTIERLNSPFLSFDRYLGGGAAVGKITTYSALNSCGKTSMALAIAGANPDKIIGFCDNEYNWTDSSYLWIDKYFGIEKERIIVLQPEFLEEGAEMVEDLCNVSDLVIFDGFDSLPPKGEFQATMEEQQMGLQARAYKKFFRKTMGKIYKSNTALLITNHLYENIGNPYEPFKEPGGQGISDFASQKLFLTRANIKDKSNKITGQDVNITIKKDKLTGNRGAKFSIPYDNKTGFDVIMDILNNSVELGVIERGGAWYSYNGSKLGQGLDNTKETLRDNPDLVEELKQKCKEKW